MNLTDQIKLMRSIFDGRRDAYGLETSSKAVTVRQPLTDELFSDHIEGKKRIGFFPLLQTGQVKVACIDLDREDREFLTRVIVNLLEKEFYPYTEKSKSRGYHVWLFFDEPIQASLIRDVLSQITKKAGDKEIEIFPKQNSVNQKSGLGNYIYLPLHGESVKNGRTVFLNSQFQPYEDQWEHFSKVHRTKTENILSMARGKKEEPKTENPTPEGVLDLSNYLIAYNILFKKKKEPTRTIYTLSRCLWSENHTTKSSQGDSAIIQGNDGKLGYQCFHNHCQDKTWADARKKISGDDPLNKFLKGYTKPKVQINIRGEGKSLSQILSEPEVDEKYLVKPILSKGDKGFVVSSYKMGKTLLLTQLTLCLSMAVPFLDFDISEPAKVLYVRFELKDRRFRKRLRLMVEGLGIENIKVEPTFELVRGFNITDKKDFDWLIGMVEKHEAEVLIIDPLYKVANFDLKDTASAMPLIRRFDSIIERYPDLLIILAHHLRKSTGDEKDSWDSTYGPMFFFADMDFELRIKAKHRENPEFTMEYISNDLPIDPITFKRNPETLLYYISNPGDDHLGEIIEYVEGNNPTKGNLKDWLQSTHGYSRRQGEGIVEQAIKNGKIIYEGKGKRGKLSLPKQVLFEPAPLV